jgi:Cu+-exporting ATPase
MFLFVFVPALLWGGELFLRGAYAELKKFYIGFNALASINGLAIFSLCLLDNINGKSILEMTGYSLLLSVSFSLLNFFKAAELRYFSKSFAFSESLDNFMSRSALKEEEWGALRRVFSSEIEIGDTIIVKRGERVPVDAVISEGCALVDEYLLTGNITPSVKQKGDSVYAASVNKGADFKARAASLKNNSRMAKILQAVKENEKGKLASPNIFENLAAPVLLFFVFTSIVQFCFGLYVDGFENMRYWTSIFFFILSCAVPAVYMIAAYAPLFFLKRGAAKKGIKINNPYILKTLAKTTKVFIDKTGTLTAGKFEVSDIIAAQGVKEAEVIKAAFISQQQTDGAFAAAINKCVKKYKLKKEKLLSAELYPGAGALVKTHDKTIISGRASLLEQFGIKIRPLENEHGKTFFYVAQDGEFLGAICFIDRLRANVKATIAYLEKSAKKVCMVSGDNSAAVGIAAQKAAISEYYGDMFPQDKAAKIAAQRNIGEVITMIGDGFNDILALLNADASIAFSTGQDVFSGWMDISVSSKDFDSVKRVFEFDGELRAVTRQNIFILIVYGLSAFYSILNYSDNILSREIAVLVISLIIIILNSARLNK